MKLNLDRLWFSRRESNYAISRSFRSNLGQPETILLRFIYGGRHQPIFDCRALLQGQVIPVTSSATTDTFTMASDSGRIDWIMPDPNMLRIRTQGIGLRLVGLGPEWALLCSAGGNRWRSIIDRSKLLFIPLHGELSVTSNWRPKPGERHRHHGCDPMIVDLPPDAELLLCGYESETLPPEVNEDFESARARVMTDFTKWRDACPPAPEPYAETRELAAYIGWSSVVPAAGNFPFPSMLMSKNWMVNTWNWDNYFNAWGSVYRDPKYAWQQYMLHLKHQHPTGALGDAINELSIGWSYTKPPVHGWILRKMLAIDDSLDHAKLSFIYESLCRWTQWWFTYRDDDGDGICQYHHGNDSGWDDATTFDVGVPNESPDLNALLVLQMEVLGELADRLGQSDEARRWKQQSIEQLQRFIAHSWRGEQFVSMQSGTHHYGKTGDSLLNYIPLVLGHRLPQGILNSMISGLTRPGRFLGTWGLASEAMDSPEFLPQGYWRGALWSPPMMMIIDGLADAGQTDLAHDLAQRFCRLCSIHGLAENYAALTGEPHHDPAYTWSASIWLILCHTYLCGTPALQH